jgi:16S rRNA U516 pseudouridylate synthase RsuA-like enzyme
MLFAIGHPVRELARVEFAGLHGDGLAEGQYRSLKTEEVKDLKARVGL